MPIEQCHRLLVIDDDPSLHELLNAMLAGADWAVDCASSGEEALARLQSNSYDLLLSDILMPGMDGLTLLAELRKSHREIPVVMMTVNNTPDHILVSLRREAAAYLSKPFARETLINTLENSLHAAVSSDDIKVLSDGPNWISLQVRCHLATAERLTHFVRELPAELNSAQREEIATAFRELLMNAVEHGGHLDPEKTVDLSYIRTARTIVYYIRDPGEGFSMDSLTHAAIATPNDPVRHLEVRRQMGIRPGGFGLLMTKQFADELIYSSKGNEVILIKYLANP